MNSDIGLTPGLIDAAIVALIALSALVGIVRGFTREFLGMLGGLGAIIITIAAYMPVYTLIVQHFGHQLGPAWVCHIVTAVGIFLPSYILLRLLSGWMSRIVKGSFLQGLDRTLGGLWGILRGWLILSLILVGIATFIPLWLESLQTARLYGLLRVSALTIMQHLPTNLAGVPLTTRLSNPQEPSSSQTLEILTEMKPRHNG